MGCLVPGGLPNKIPKTDEYLNLSAVWRFYFLRSSLFCYIIRSHGPKIKHIYLYNMWALKILFFFSKEDPDEEKKCATLFV